MTRINKRKIYNFCKPYVIAEACINHNGNFEKAIKMIIEAKKANACAIKFQMHNLDDEMLKKTPRSNNFKDSLYETLKKTNFTTEQHIKLKKICERNNIDYLCTPFSRKSVDVLVNQVKVGILKVGSGELTNIPLQIYIAKKKIPTIISTGMSNENEIMETIKNFEKYNKKIIITHCTSVYPCPPELTNIGYIAKLQKKFKYPIGLSDHTNTIYTSFAAVSLGAAIVEKHFTLNKKDIGPDHASSIEPKELKQLTEGCIVINKSLGNKKFIHKAERQIIEWARESVVTIKKIEKNEKFSENNLSVKRPAPNNYEIPAKFLFKIFGKRAKKKIYKDCKLKWSEIA